MHVLQICHCYYPPFLDCARQYAALFRGSDYKVTTVYLTGQADKEVERASCSDEVIFLGYESKEVGGLKLGAIRRIKQIVSRKSYQFCIAHRSKPTYVALFATNLPVISVHHSYGDYSRFSRRLTVNLFRKRLLMLAVSDSVRDEMRRHLAGWPQERIQTLYNRIDVDTVRRVMLPRAEARQRLKLPLDAWVIANVGRLHRDKDQATLIHGFAKALSYLPLDSLLLIVGKGPLEKSLKQLANELGIENHVRFAGQVVEARRYFRAFDIFALTSDHEPFGMVLLEAMVAGLPIICSECGGAVEVVKGFGHTFPLGDADQLATLLIKTARQDSASSNMPVMQDILNEKFTDEAARQRFWNLLFIKQISITQPDN